jgi:sugar O-acyltransferase (sialic acid O-acetyltransferase NeuD family)
MTQPVIVIGAGGHATVLADALLAAGRTVLGYTDADPARHGQQLLGLPVLGDDISTLAQAGHAPGRVELVIGLGSTGAAADLPRRERLHARFSSAGYTIGGVRHPAAVVSVHAQVHPTAQLLAACVVQAGAQVGEGCIVNTAAVVEHDAVLGAHSHLAPRALLCGSVQLGERCHVGAGAVVRQGLVLGADTVVGAGAVVLAGSAGGVVLTGVPARARPAAREARP